MKMQKADFRFDLKSVSEADGSFVGLASTYGGPPDSQGDVVMPGAFSKTLRDAKGPWPVLAGHNVGEQIGFCDLQDSVSGLLVKGQLVLETEKAKQACALMRAKALRGLSIGYDAIRTTQRGDVRQLNEVKLYEISLTPFPANERAVVTAVKNADSGAAVAQFCRTLQMCTKEIRGR
jgi:hypothetical protein